jgi:hypothetical protein
MVTLERVSLLIGLTLPWGTVVPDAPEVDAPTRVRSGTRRICESIRSKAPKF